VETAREAEFVRVAGGCASRVDDRACGESATFTASLRRSEARTRSARSRRAPAASSGRPRRSRIRPGRELPPCNRPGAHVALGTFLKST